MTKYDLIVVGSGPAGCKTAEIVSREGYKVLVIEEHAEAGVPTQCTGFVSKKIGKIPANIVINKISRAKFIAGENEFEIKTKESMQLMDRRAFDDFLFKQAKDCGVEFKFNTRFVGYENRKVITTNGVFETEMLVGADGPNSTVAKVTGLKLPENQLFLVQVRARGNFDSTVVKLYFGSDIAPGNFAWVVPENEEVARVGLMSPTNPADYFEEFLKIRFGDRIEFTDKIGDVIRYGLIEKSVADGVLLVGDAAAQVKPFSAGGLVYGQLCAQIAGGAIVKAFQTNNFSEKFLKENYERHWKKKIGKGIKKGILMKKVFKKIQDKPLIFSMIKRLGISYLAEFFDVDFAGKG
jgi:digeranylgeranylglycerophospholipid reductase